MLGWNIKTDGTQGKPITTPVSLPVRDSTIMALSEDDLLCNFYDKANSESFCDLKRCTKSSERPCARAGQYKHTHKSKVTMDKLDEFKGDITALHPAVHARDQLDQSAMENDKESDCKHVVRVD